MRFCLRQLVLSILPLVAIPYALQFPQVLLQQEVLFSALCLSAEAPRSRSEFVEDILCTFQIALRFLDAL